MSKKKDADFLLKKLQQQFFLVSILYYLSNIANIYTAIARFEESLSYPIFFFVLIGSEKLLTIVCFDGIKGQNTQLWILDLFQIGFVFFWKYRIDAIPQIERIMIEILGARLIPILLIQLFYNFGGGFLLNSKLPDHIIILSYISFLVLFVVAVAIISLLAYREKMQSLKKVFFSCLITLGCYYIMIGSLSQFFDGNGINLGYIVLIICSINFIIYLILSPPIQDIYIFVRETLFYIFQCCVINNTLSYDKVYAHYFSCSVRNSTVISYYTALIKIVLLCAFSYQKLWDIFTNKYGFDVKMIIMAVNAILSITLNLIFLIYFFKYIVKQIIKLKKIVISKTSDFDKALKIMEKQHKHLKVLYICVCLKQRPVDPLKRHLILENFCSLDCQKMFELYQNYSNCLKKGMQIEFQNETLQICDCYTLKLTQEVDIIHSRLQRPIAKFVQRQPDKPQIIFQALFFRFMNGLGETVFTDELKNLDHIHSVQALNKILKLQSQLLQITAFYSKYQEYMLYFPSRILYDLYENF